MARSRNIKPAFFTNDDLASLPALTRLLFIGLWTIADREGRLEDKPKRIRVEVLPYDDGDVDAMLDALASHKFLVRYVVGENRYIQIMKFAKHQNPHKKEAASLIPAPEGWEIPESAPEIPEHEQEIPASSRLIPDSLLLIPDSGSPSEDTVPSEPVAAEAADRLPPVPFKALVDLYHETMPLNGRCMELNSLRSDLIRARWKQVWMKRKLEGKPRTTKDLLDGFKAYFELAATSKLLTGRADPDRDGYVWPGADLEWLMRPSNFTKVRERKYGKGRDAA